MTYCHCEKVRRTDAAIHGTIPVKYGLPRRLRRLVMTMKGLPAPSTLLTKPEKFNFSGRSSARGKIPRIRSRWQKIGAILDGCGVQIVEIPDFYPQKLYLSKYSPNQRVVDKLLTILSHDPPVSVASPIRETGRVRISSGVTSHAECVRSPAQSESR